MGRTKNEWLFPLVSTIRTFAEPRQLSARPTVFIEMAFTARALRNGQLFICASGLGLWSGRRPKGICDSSFGRVAFRLALSILIWSHLSASWAAEPAAEDFSQPEPAPANSEAVPGTERAVQSLFPVLISLGAHAGYDTNSRTTSNSEGSFFTSQELTLSYDRLRGPTEIDLVAGMATVERFSRGTDVNAFFDLSLTHNVSQRLSLSGGIDLAYRAEPDFSSDAGPNARQGNYFTSSDRIAASYQWTERWSTVTSYSFRVIRYENSEAAFFTDREEHGFGEELRFELGRHTVLVGDYRLLLVNYDSFPRDSTTHSALVGAEQTFTPRLTAQARAGASFRSFETGENSVDPDFEGSVDYALARYSSLSWNMRYGVEEPSVQDALSRKTLRTGLQLNYGFTSKLSSALGLFYHHDETMGGTTTLTAGPTFSTDAVDLSLSARYQLTSHLDMDAGFQHSEVSSGGQDTSYSRNRYTFGINFTF